MIEIIVRLITILCVLSLVLNIIYSIRMKGKEEIKKPSSDEIKIDTMIERLDEIVKDKQELSTLVNGVCEELKIEETMEIETFVGILKVIVLSWEKNAKKTI